MMRRNHIATLSVGLLITANHQQLAAQSTNPSRPNLLFIMTDQQRWDAMSIAGNTVISTPNLDRIGREGACFQNFYSTRAICVPARASILTGRSPQNTGIYGNGDLGITKTANGTSFDQILHAQGYYTRYFGKFHTPTNLLWSGNQPTYDNPDIGNHDHNVLLVRKDPGETKTQASVFLEFLNGTDPLKLNTNYVPRSTVADPAHNLYVDNGYKALYEALPLDENRAGGTNTQAFGRILVPDEYSEVAFVAKATLQALDDAAATNKPFSITCSIGPPHAPMLPPSPWFEQFPAANMPVPASIGDLFINQPYAGADPGYNDPATIGQMIQCYYGLVADADYWIGKVLDKLDALGLATNTLVVFTSDHGEMLGDHGKNSKSFLWEGATHIPGLFRFPAAIPAGTVVKTPAAQIDLFPTILDYLGVSAPGYQVDGYSLRPLIEGDAGTGDHPDYCVSEDRLYTTGTRANNKPMYAVRTEKWKLIVAEDDTSTARDALYDMINDPNEMNNLIGSAAGQWEYREVAESMKARLVDYLTRLNSPEITNIQNRVVVPVSPKKEGTLNWSADNTVLSNSELSLVEVAAAGNTIATNIGGRMCRAKANPATDMFFYLKSDPSLFYRTPGAKIAVECDYYVAANPTRLSLRYDSVKGPVDHPLQVETSDVGQWKTARWYLDDALFGEQLPSGTDFSIRIPAGVEGCISRVKLVLPKSSDWPPFTINATGIQWPVDSGALGWKLYANETLANSATWLLVTNGISTTNGLQIFTPSPPPTNQFFRMQRN